jgi:GH25 family lysozyme M1 (1,4-beta-N-acetylmuramidase)
VTVFGWDASHWDWPRGPMDLAAARDEGIEFFTHKAAEGDRHFRDPKFAEAIARAKAAGIPAYGAYFVLHPGSAVGQADWFMAVLDETVPDWRTDERFVIQLDAERFPQMPREPSPAECKTWCQHVQAACGKRTLLYAPRWLYGDTLAEVGYPLWASRYVRGAGPFPALYPGDGSAGWQPYSGQTPALLQYSDRATIAGQSPCCVDAYRGSVDDLLAVAHGEDDDVTPDQANQLEQLYNAMFLGGSSMGQPVADEHRGPLDQVGNALVSQLAEVRAALADLAARPVTLSDEQLAHVLADLRGRVSAGAIAGEIVRQLRGEG